MNKFKHYYYNKLLNEADRRGGTIQNIYLNKMYIKELPSFFKDITVEYECSIGSNLLTSCKNFPRVLWAIYAGHNSISNTDDLINMPHTLHLNNNKLTSLESFSRFEYSSLLMDFNFKSNKIKSMRGLENINFDRLVLSRNEISSWEHSPTIIRTLDITYNKLTSWKGMPPKVTHLYCNDNWDVLDMENFTEVVKTLIISSSLKQGPLKLEFEKRNLPIPSEVITHSPNNNMLQNYE